MKLKSLSADKYEEWGADELVHWMVSIEPKVYGQYEEALTKALAEEQVTGECMDDIDVADIKRWVVVNFKHSKRLPREVKALVQGGAKQVNKPFEEGANAPTAYI